MGARARASRFRGAELDRFLTFTRPWLERPARYGPHVPLHARIPPPEHLVASIVALAEQSNRLALDAAMEAAAPTPAATPPSSSIRSAASRSAPASPAARSPGSSASSSRHRRRRQLAEAGVAVAGMENCIRAVAHAVEEVADRGAPVEIPSPPRPCAASSVQLAELLPRLQFALSALSRASRKARWHNSRSSPSCRFTPATSSILRRR